MSQVQVFGKMHCRGDTDTLIGVIDIADINKAIEFGKRRKVGEEVSDEFDDWMESNYPKYTHHLGALLCGVYEDSFDSINEAEWNSEHTLQIILEEYDFGVGLTKKAAKLAWVETQ